jgi:hypothetical protein
VTTQHRVIIVICVAFVAVVRGERRILSAADALGSLVVESDPAGASVYLDGHLAGETPLTLPAIAAGVHRVRVVRLGYLENSRVVTVKPGARATLRARLTDPAPQTAQAAALKIVVLEGEGAVNIIQQQTAVAPVIEVRDRNDQPVSGAIVKFAIQKGKASFDGARTLTVTTNAAGRATATGFTATGRGALQIGTSAAFQGQTAAATIAQTTVMTTAEASAITSGGAASAGGGVSHTALAVILGGAGVAGGVLAAKQTSADQTEIFSPAGTWSYVITANVPLNSGLIGCAVQSSGTTVVGRDGALSISFSGLACNSCSMSGTITGTILSQTSVAGSATASISGSGCSNQQPSPSPAPMSGTCSRSGTGTRCNVNLSGAGFTFGLGYTLAQP